MANKLSTNLGLRRLRLKYLRDRDMESVRAINQALYDSKTFEACCEYTTDRYAQSIGVNPKELGDGQILARLTEFLSWILENGPALIEFIMMIVNIFSEEDQFRDVIPIEIDHPQGWGLIPSNVAGFTSAGRPNGGPTPNIPTPPAA